MSSLTYPGWVVIKGILLRKSNDHYTYAIIQNCMDQQLSLHPCSMIYRGRELLKQ